MVIVRERFAVTVAETCRKRERKNTKILCGERSYLSMDKSKLILKAFPVLLYFVPIIILFVIDRLRSQEQKRVGRFVISFVFLSNSCQSPVSYKNRDREEGNMETVLEATDQKNVERNRKE